MANTIGTAYVQIIPSAQGIKGSIEGIMKGEADSAGTSSGKAFIGKFGGALKATGAKIAKIGAGMTAAGAGLSVLGHKYIELAETQAQAELKLTTIYRDRMGATKKAAKSTMELASALQAQGVVGDEVTISGAQQLATFAKYPKTVDALLPAMDNLLVQQHGLNGTTQDAVGIANLMGKAMQGQTGALTRVGITFTDAQAKVLKYGNEQERAATLAKVINDNVGNMNEEFAKTDAGKLQQAKNTLGDIGEKIGATLMPAISSIAKWVSANLLPKIESLVGFLESHPVLAKIAVGVTAFLAIAGPLITTIGGIVMAAGVLAPVLGAISVPMVAAGLAIGVVVAYGVQLYRNWDKIKASAKKTWGSVKATISSFVEGAKAKFQSFKSFTASVWNAIKNAITHPVQTAKNLIRGYINVIGRIVGVPGLAGKVSGVWNSIRHRMTAPIQAARSTLRGIINSIKGWFPLRIGRIMSNIKTPTINLNLASKRFGKLGSIKYPTGFRVGWHAKGAIFREPTIIGQHGFGEAGPEAALPLNPFWKRFDSLGGDIVGAVAAQLRTVDTSGGTVTLIINLDGKVLGEAVVEYVNGQTIITGINPIGV